MQNQQTGRHSDRNERFFNDACRILVATFVFGLCALPAQGANVWLDFISGAGPNWVDELNEATSLAGVSDFTEAERATIESNILSSLETTYEDFVVVFSLTDPGGSRERINMGATTSGTSIYGSAPFDFLNDFTSTQSIYTANFDNFLESYESRDTQIAEISASLAGTVAHELGHSFGLRHQASYGTDGIEPDTYSNTGGLQNSHIMATGGTGLNELERETARTFSRWSRLSMETADVYPLVASPLPHSGEALSDAGDTPASAQILRLVYAPVSGFNAAVVVGAEIEPPPQGSSTYDVDVYSFSAQSGALLSADLWSVKQYPDDFDGRLTLIGPDGLTTIYSDDDVLFSGDSFGTGTKRDDDTFLLNIPLTETGTYYLMVETLGPDPNNSSGDADGDYDLLVGVWPSLVPEPSALVLALSGLALLSVRRWRKHLPGV